MPKVLITDIVASSVKSVAGKQLSLWDSGTKGFGLRINPQGTKTWQVMIGEKRKRVTIGHYPRVSLKDARKLAMKVIADGEAPPKKSAELTPYTAAAAVSTRARMAVVLPMYVRSAWLTGTAGRIRDRTGLTRAARRSS